LRSINIALSQLLVEGGESKRNLARAIDSINKSKSLGCDLVVLPETLDLGWTHPSALNESQKIPGPRSDLLCESAKKNNIWVCAGLTESHNDEIYNTAILINRKGEITLKYRKINVLEAGLDFYNIGQSLSTVQTEFGTIGLNICSDNYSDSLHLAHSLCRMGAQIILSPSSWTVDYSISEDDDPYKSKWIKPYQYISSLYGIAIIGVTSVGYIVGGPYEGKKSVGCSLGFLKGDMLVKTRFNEFCSELNSIEFEIPDIQFRGTQIGKMLKSKDYEFDGLGHLVT